MKKALIPLLLAAAVVNDELVTLIILLIISAFVTAFLIRESGERY